MDRELYSENSANVRMLSKRDDRRTGNNGLDGVSLPEGFCHGLNDSLQFFFFKAGVKGKRDASTSQAFGHWEIASLKTVGLAKVSEQMDGPIIYHRRNTAAIQMPDYLISAAGIHPNRKQVISMHTRF